jgi:hypothetical protein
LCTAWLTSVGFFREDMKKDRMRWASSPRGWAPAAAEPSQAAMKPEG